MTEREKEMVRVMYKVAAWLAREKWDDGISEACAERIVKHAILPLANAAKSKKE